MKTCLVQSLAGVSVGLLFGASFAQPVNDQKNYLGDKLVYPVRVMAEYTTPKEGETDRSVCIPANTTLRGMGSADDALFVQVRDEVSSCNAPHAKIDTDRILKISRADEPMKSLEPARYGLTYGALVVPYKYFYSGSKDFISQTSIGPYFGYRSSTLGFETKLIGFFGATTASVTQNVNGQNATQSLAGFSYGIGLIGEIKQSFQLGIVIGVDKVSDSVAYPNSGQPWVAVSLGFEFNR